MGAELAVVFHITTALTGAAVACVVLAVPARREASITRKRVIDVEEEAGE